MIDQVTQENIIRGEFSFLRKRLLAELQRQIGTRIFDQMRFDETFEHHMLALVFKLALRVQTETPEAKPEVSPADSPQFPSAQHT